ncbi:MAG TPA: hypothetical protein VKJ65_12370 [Phycisphaerae bacterium]|nr:hypothetical protein [Phycisphaerae bacterium]
MNILVPDKPELYFLIVAGAVGSLGVVLWLAAVRCARPLLTFALTAAGAYIGFLAPNLWHWNFSYVTTLICGSALGLFLGSIFFRPIQALLLAGFLAAFLSGWVAYQDGAFRSLPPELKPIVTQAQTNPGSAFKPPATEPAKFFGIQNIHNYVKDQIGKLTDNQRSQVYALGVGIFLVVLLLGLLFVHATSMVGGAWLGAIFMVWSACVFLEYFRSSALAWVLQHNATHWALLVLGIMGMAIQSHTILEKQKKSDGKKKKKTEKKSEEK